MPAIVSLFSSVLAVIEIKYDHAAAALLATAQLYRHTQPTQAQICTVTTL
jgi:hypothetical protein